MTGKSYIQESTVLPRNVPLKRSLRKLPPNIWNWELQKDRRFPVILKTGYNTLEDLN